MEPEYEGFCKACNGYSLHLRRRLVVNKNTDTVGTWLFCTDCLKRFGLFPFDKPDEEDIVLDE